MADSVEDPVEPHPITMEQVPAGATPEWLTSHFESQSKDPRSLKRGGLSRLLIIHPTEASRREILSRLSGLPTGGPLPTSTDDVAAPEPAPIDRSQHHTLDSLVRSLHAELRQARLLPTGGVFRLLLHDACEEAAKNLLFPLIHTLPSHEWGRGKTRDLAALHQALREEELGDWVGPGLDSFGQILNRLGGKLGGIHPDLQLRTVVEILEKRPVVEIPFGLMPVDGVVMLDHPPTLSPLRRRLIQALTRFRPLHVLANSGSHRLGVHGFVPNDLPPARARDDLPDWLPSHEVWRPPEDTPSDTATRLLVPRIERSIEATHALLVEALGGESPPDSVLLVDPKARAHRESWCRVLDSLGIPLPMPARPLCESPGVHWLLALAGLAHRENAWELTRLRALAVQRTLEFRSDWLQPSQHPSEAEWKPVPDVSVLEEVSRGFHVLGGRGALGRWLRSLSRPPLWSGYEDEAKLGRRHEQTQWWLLCLASRLRPLLSAQDKAALDVEAVRVGCHSGEPLPLPITADTGDGWLAEFAGSLRWERWTDSLDGEVHETLAGLQLLFDAHSRLRQSQSLLGQNPNGGGGEWVDDLSVLVDGIDLPGSTIPDPLVRLLTPEEALGCRADLVILTHLDADSWDLRAPSVPGLAEQERAELGVLPPDAPLRGARHALNHLLWCAVDSGADSDGSAGSGAPNGGGEVIILDAAEDGSSQPSTPLTEWLAGREWRPGQPPVLPSFVSGDEVHRIDGDAGSRWGLSFIEGEGAFPCARPGDVVSDGEGGYEAVVTGSMARDVRQRSGLSLHSGRNPELAPLNPASVSISLDSRLVSDRLDRQPRMGTVERPYLPADRLGDVVSPENLRMKPQSREPRVTPPRLNPTWPTIGLSLPNRSRSLTVDPRPLSPDPTDLADHDHRHGFVNGPKFKTEVWSPSRLAQWLSCPRKGWLSTRLQATAEEAQDDDVDVRTRGLLVHGVYADLLCDLLGMEVGEERESLEPTSLAHCGTPEPEMRARLLHFVEQRAPWLKRGDAVASVRRLGLLGMNREEFEKASGTDSVPNLKGRFGRMLDAELTLSKAAVLALEWPLPRSSSEPGVLLELPEEGALGGLRLRGTIDRVELIPFEEEGGSFVDESGSDEVCPLDLDLGEEWRPRRLVVIRDLKSLEGPPRKDAGMRHRRELLEGVQLALYARAWEVTHPGDRVVGIGIAEVGEESALYIEADPDYELHLTSLGIGEVACNSSNIHRRPGESHESPKSNTFRAWLRHRLTAALRINDMSASGRVIPTPSGIACTYCSVKEVCGLAPIVGGDREWS
jgi:hypothetical protein